MLYSRFVKAEKGENDTCIEGLRYLYRELTLLFTSADATNCVEHCDRE